jgi:hypothetical protein
MVPTHRPVPNSRVLSAESLDTSGTVTGGPKKKRKHYSEEKFIAILTAHEAGVSVPNLSSHHGIAENTINFW